ncbi:MAG: rod shape-determining protein [Clostridia bacterium]|nr:rod shape-determining protein [Clostridia bacterium]
MRNFGIDLGTSNTLIYEKGRGIVLREPSVVARESQSGKVVAVGGEARLMLGKTPGSITAFKPLRDGVIAEFDVTAKMLHRFFKKVAGNSFFSRPRVVVCIPYGVTEVEKRAVEDATLEAGAQSVALIEEPIASAIGAGLNIASAKGNMIVDIGGGTSEVAVISLGGIVLSNSLRTAGDKLDDAITNFIKRKYNVVIGDNSSENLKKTIGTVFPGINPGTMEVRGRNLMTGLPATITVASDELMEAMDEEITHIVERICVSLENTPPELAADIYDNGIMLAGGGALLAGLPNLVSKVTGVRTHVAKMPLDCVALGIGKVIESPDKTLGDGVSYRTR